MGVIVRTLLVSNLILFVSSCAPKEQDIEIEAFATSLRVFALILEEIVGSPGEIQVLISDTQSPHAYHPRPSDISRLSTSRALFLGDDALDGWAESLGQTNVIYLSAMLEPSQMLLDGGSPNPHFWTDPAVVRRLLAPLASSLCELNPTSCSTYRDNAETFSRALSDLEIELREAMNPMIGRCFFTSQPFFNYFLTRFGMLTAGTLEAVPGHESSAAHIVSMLNKAQTLDCAGIISQRRLPDTSARLFSDETGLAIIYLDPVGTREVQSYAELLRMNASALLSANSATQ